MDRLAEQHIGARTLALVRGDIASFAADAIFVLFPADTFAAFSRALGAYARDRG